MIKKIKRASIEGHLIASSIKYIKKILSKVVKKIDRTVAYPFRRHTLMKGKIEDNKIMLVTSRGTYNCNLRAISDEIIKQKLPWEIVWVIRKKNLQTETYPEQLKLVVRDSMEFYQEAASAKVLIDNSINLEYMGVCKKNNQTIVEVWHGSYGIKRFDTTTDKHWIRKAIRFGRKTDYCITNSKTETKLMQNSYWKDAEYLELGKPRTDILFESCNESQEKISNELRALYGIDRDMKIALYGPTYRDDKSSRFDTIDYELLHNTLVEKFGGEWCILTRFHFLQKKTRSISCPYVIDVSDYKDIEDILVLADIGITDYSSWVCDYVNTLKPIFLYTPDYDEFKKGRGFSFPLEDTPFSMAYTNDELSNNIMGFADDQYQMDCKKFLEYHGCVDDGYSAYRIVNKLKEMMC